MSILLFPVWTESPVCVHVYEASGNTRTDKLVTPHFRELVTGNTQSRLFACLILSHDKKEKKTRKRKKAKNQSGIQLLTPTCHRRCDPAWQHLRLFFFLLAIMLICMKSVVFVSLQRSSATSLHWLLLRQQNCLSFTNLSCDLRLMYQYILCASYYYRTWTDPFRIINFLN